MRYFIFRLLFLLTIALSPLGWVAEPVYSQDVTTTAHPIDVVIVLDDSGSMHPCCFNPPSDPDYLRYSAARLLVHLADDDDRIATIRFDQSVENVGSGQLVTVGGPEARKTLLNSIQPPENPGEREYTRIDLGIQRAAEILTARNDSSRPGYVLFLTDGSPTQPEGVGSQFGSVQATITALREQNMQVFPVALCNAVRGCPIGFLNDTMGGAREAKSAGDLIRQFSEIFAEMKPNLHVVDSRDADGNLVISTRPAHGARQLTIVGAKGNFISLQRNGSPEAVSPTFEDDNIELNVIEKGVLPEGKWTVSSQDQSGFIVARTNTFPEIVHPPRSVAGNNAPRFYPSNKSILLVATTVGPGGDEDLLLNSTQPLKALTSDETLRWTILSGSDDFSLQVGRDTQPLQLVRQFRLTPRDNLPVAQAPTPNCIANQACSLTVAFMPGPEVAGVSAKVYVSDISDASGEGKPVYHQSMSCRERQCVDEGWTPLDGHVYRVHFAVQAQSEGVLFGDWAETQVAMKPAISLRGLPDPLDPRAQPEAGWAVTVVAGTTEDLGRLRAELLLQRLEDNTPVSTLTALFSADIRGSGEQETTLRLQGLESLRPGHYKGSLTFAVDKQSVGQAVQLPAPVAVDFTIGKASAIIQNTTADFGQVLFDPSPNFRIDEEVSISVSFTEEPFTLNPFIDPQSTDCSGLQLTAQPPQAQTNDAYQVKLRLQSDDPVSPQTCSGTFTLQGPSEDYTVAPQTPLSWQIVIPQIEWNIIGAEQGSETSSDLIFTDFGNVGETGSAMLLVRYTGKPPFFLDLQELTATDDGQQYPLNSRKLEFVTGSVNEVTAQPGVYRVPVELVAKQPIEHGWFFGSRYSGELKLRVEGLPDETPDAIDFSFRSPSWPQRHIEPRVRAFYRLWWPGIVTWPLSILFILVLMALRNRVNDYDEEENRQKDNPSSTDPQATWQSGPPKEWKTTPDRQTDRKRKPRPTAASGGRLAAQKTRPTATRRPTRAVKRSKTTSSRGVSNQAPRNRKTKSSQKRSPRRGERPKRPKRRR